MCADVAEVVDKREHEGQTEFYVHYQECEPSLYSLAGAAAFAVPFCAHCLQSAALPSTQGIPQEQLALTFALSQRRHEPSTLQAMSADQTAAVALQRSTAWTAVGGAVDSHSGGRRCRPHTAATALEWASTHTAAAAALKAEGPAFATRDPHCCCCPAVDKRLDEWVPEDRLQSLPDIQAMEVPLQSIPSL